MKKNFFHVQRGSSGFTLLELLLAIAVLSLMAAFGLMSYRQYAANERIDKAAIEMQHVLEAGLAYYSDNNNWPAANNTLPDCTPPHATETFVQNYLPNGNDQSSFGGNFCWSAIGELQHPRLFWSALKVPGNNVQLAARLASRLPNAVYTTTPTIQAPDHCADANANCYVRAEVVSPGVNSQPTPSSGSSLLGMGYCYANSGAPIIGTAPDISCQQQSVGAQSTVYAVQYNCPAGTHPKIFTTPNFYQMPGWGNASYLYTLTEYASSATDTCASTANADGNVAASCTITIQATDDNSPPSGVASLGGQIGASYFAFCLSDDLRPAESKKEIL